MILVTKVDDFPLRNGPFGHLVVAASQLHRLKVLVGIAHQGAEQAGA